MTSKTLKNKIKEAFGIKHRDISVKENIAGTEQAFIVTLKNEALGLVKEVRDFVKKIETIGTDSANQELLKGSNTFIFINNY